MDGSLDELKALVASAISRQESQAEALKQEITAALRDQTKTLLDAIAKQEGGVGGGGDAPLRRQIADMEARHKREPRP